jgi:predicted dehydrogenase
VTPARGTTRPSHLLEALAADEKRPAKPIKVGQIGVSHGHASKLAVYRNSRAYEVVGVVEPDKAPRQRAETQVAFKGVTWMTREQLLNVPGLQAVLVETGVRDLLDNAEACVDAGMHIHLDKPPGESLPQLRRILEKAARKKLLVQLGYMYRYNPGVLLLRAFMKAGWLGEVFEVHTVMSKVVEPDQRRGLAEFRGGMMFELGCHVMDLVVGVLGKPKEVVPFAQHASRLDDRLMDNMLAVLTYPRASATVRSPPRGLRHRRDVPDSAAR